MIEDTKIVKTIESKQGGKSGTYWSVTWEDGKKDNVFNATWLPLLEQSQTENSLLHFTKEKKGMYYNIVSLELATLPEKPPEIEQCKTTAEPSKLKDTLKTKEEQIERAVWIKELGECLRSGEIDKTTPEGKSLRNAYYTEMCRVLGITLKSGNLLVKEAKRLGAKEIQREENNN